MPTEEALQYTRRPSTQETFFLPCVLRLLYCGSYIFEGSVTTVDEPQYTREKKVSCVLRLVYCGSYIYIAAMAAVDEEDKSPSPTVARLLLWPQHAVVGKI